MHGGTAARGVCKPVHIGGRAAVYTRKMLEVLCGDNKGRARIEARRRRRTTVSTENLSAPVSTQQATLCRGDRDVCSSTCDVQCDPNMASSDVVTNCVRNWEGGKFDGEVSGNTGEQGHEHSARWSGSRRQPGCEGARRSTLGALQRPARAQANPTCRPTVVKMAMQRVRTREVPRRPPRGR